MIAVVGLLVFLSIAVGLYKVREGKRGLNFLGSIVNLGLVLIFLFYGADSMAWLLLIVVSILGFDLIRIVRNVKRISV